MNNIQHPHFCFECTVNYVCYDPECQSLAGQVQKLCARCSYLHGWASAKDKRQWDDF